MVCGSACRAVSSSALKPAFGNRTADDGRGDLFLDPVLRPKKTRAKRTRLLASCGGGAYNQTSGRRSARKFMARHSLRHRRLRESGNRTSTLQVLTLPKRSFRPAGLRRSAVLACTVIATAQIVAFVPAHAQTFWTGNTSSDWFTTSNWAGGALPTTAADAILDTILPNPTVVNGPGAQALDLVIGGLGTGALTIGSGGTVNNNVGHVGGCSGCGTGTFGTVTVSGVGAIWTNAAGL